MKNIGLFYLVFTALRFIGRSCIVPRLEKSFSLCPPITLVLGSFKFVSSSYEGAFANFGFAGCGFVLVWGSSHKPMLSFNLSCNARVLFV